VWAKPGRPASAAALTGVASTIMPNTAVHSTTDRQLQFHAEDLLHGNSVIVGHGTVHLLLSRRWDVARNQCLTSWN
jgi:hypothetical protein